MIRELFIASAVAGAAIAAAPGAAAEQGWEGDVPGIIYGVRADQRCDNLDVFIFGRGDDGQAMMCRFIPNQWPPKPWGTWLISYPLYGVQETGAPCPGPQAAAQHPDGRPMLCLGARGWQPGSFISGPLGGIGPVGPGFIPG